MGTNVRFEAPVDKEAIMREMLRAGQTQKEAPKEKKKKAGAKGEENEGLQNHSG